MVIIYSSCYLKNNSIDKICIYTWLTIDILDYAQLNVYHGQGLISNKTKIGNNVIVIQNTTIGNAQKGGSCTTIGNNVEIGVNALVI